MSALPSRCHSGQCKTAEKDGDQGIPGIEILNKKCEDGLQKGWRKMEAAVDADAVKWSVTYAALGARRHQSKQGRHILSLVLMMINDRFNVS